MPSFIFANQYSTEIILASCEPAAGLGINFGFAAQYVRVHNLAAVSVHVNLNSTSPATTGDPELRPGLSPLIVEGIPISGMGLSTTSTTTSTGDDGHRVTVAAFGA